MISQIKSALRNKLSEFSFLPIPVQIRIGNGEFLDFWWGYPANDFDLRWGRARYRGTDAREIELMSKLIKPDDVFFDVGSYHGLYAIVAAKLTPFGRVVAFEPSPREIDMLRRNIGLNGLDVLIEPLAISSSNAELEFFVVEDGFQTMNSLRHPADQRDCRSITVSATTLDSYFLLNNFSRLDYLKLDTEGGELDALRGAENTIAKCRPNVQVEVVDWVCQGWNYQARDILVHLNKREYVAYEYLKDGGVREHSLCRNYPEISNFLCVPAEKTDIHQALSAFN